MSTASLPNAQTLLPCTSLCDLVDTIINIVYFGMSLALFIIAPVAVVAGGLWFTLGGANPGMLESGKKTITGAVIGVAHRFMCIPYR